MKCRLFFPQAMLDVLVDADKVDVDGDELVLLGAECRYKIIEGVHILHEVTTGEDPHDLCGKVKSRNYLTEVGAELLGDSLIYEDSGYEVVSGFICLPVGNFDSDEVETERELLQALNDSGALLQ